MTVHAPTATQTAEAPTLALPTLRLPSLLDRDLASLRDSRPATPATHLTDSPIPLGSLRREIPTFNWPLCRRLDEAGRAPVPRPTVPFCDEVRARPAVQPAVHAPAPISDDQHRRKAVDEPLDERMHTSAAGAHVTRSRESLVAAMHVLMVAMLFKAGVVLAELVGAIASGSLAVLTDMVHMSIDLLAVGIALTAARSAVRGTAAMDGPTRLELLAVRVNAVILLVLGSIMALEALQALTQGHTLESVGWLAAVAVVRLVGSWAMARVLEHGAQHSLNLRAVHTHARADMLGSAGMLVGAAVIQLAGAAWVDALLALGIAIYIARNGWHLLDECQEAHAQTNGRVHAHAHAHARAARA